MASGKFNLTSQQEASIPSGEQFRIGIVVAEWNTEVTEKLYQACYHTLIKYRTLQEHIITLQVPGSFELPQAAQLLLESQEMDAVICLGCIVRGETTHDQHIATAVANGITQVGLDYNTPVIFGVLTTNDMQQAHDRAGGKYGNKGEEAAITALRMAAIRSRLI